MSYIRRSHRSRDSFKREKDREKGKEKDREKSKEKEKDKIKEKSKDKYKEKREKRDKSKYKSKERNKEKSKNKEFQKKRTPHKSIRNKEKSRVKSIRKDTNVINNANNVKVEKEKSIARSIQKNRSENKDIRNTSKKLKNLLLEKKYIVTRYYVDKNYPNIYRYVEVISKVNYSSLLIDLEHSSLKFEVSNDSDKDYTFNIVNIDTEKFGSLPQVNSELYKEIKVLDNINLELKYKKDIKLGADDEETLINIGGIFSQLKRFLYSVKRLKYKISIIDKEALCVIDKKNKIKCYSVPKLDDEKRNILATIDIESFYSSDNTHSDVKKIYEQLQDILDSSHEDHTLQIQSILDNKADIVNKSMHLLSVKKACETKLKELYSFLDELKENESELKKQVEKLTKEDMVANAGKINKINEGISRIENIRAKTLDSIFDERSKLSYLLLTIDSILYNNISMLLKIYENFKVLNVVYDKF